VHERHLRSGRDDGRAVVGDVGQRFATERSAEVAQEDQQDGHPLLQIVERRRQRPLPAG